MTIFFKKKFLFSIAILISFLGLFSCKSKSIVLNNSKNETKLIESKAIENYNNTKFEFTTLAIKSDIQVETQKINQSVTAEIKIKKDEQILISIRFLGITMGKALITPTKVSYYEKLKSTYYEGDFSSLSLWLGTDLDFEKLQNMLLGRAIDNLKPGQYTETFSDQVYKLDNIAEENTKKSFFIEGGNFTLNKQEVSQTKEERMIQVVYDNKKTFAEMILPTLITINSVQKGNKAVIKMEFNSINFNQELSFPFSIPNDYKRIIIN